MIHSEGTLSKTSLADARASPPTRRFVSRSPSSVLPICWKFVSSGSLRQSMKAKEPTPTGEWKEESTVFADVERMQLEGSSIRVYDCAGQVNVVHAGDVFWKVLDEGVARDHTRSPVARPTCELNRLQQSGAAFLARKVQTCTINIILFVIHSFCLSTRVLFAIPDVTLLCTCARLLHFMSSFGGDGKASEPVFTEYDPQCRCSR